MTVADTTVAGEIEAIRQVKARYCRFLDTKDFESCDRWWGSDDDATTTRPMKSRTAHGESAPCT